jgi:hypothetical protein
LDRKVNGRSFKPHNSDRVKTAASSEARSVLQNIQYLREISRTCLSGQPLTGKLARWLGVSLDQFLNQRVRSLEDAMGIRSPRGGVPWWMEEAIRRRDRALRALADRFAAHLHGRAQACFIHQLATRYAASAWRFDRQTSMLPKGYAGSCYEYLWLAFSSGAPMPIGERRLRSVLSR